MAVELEKSYMIAYRPDIEDVGTQQGYYFDIIKKSLEISSYSRLGGRFIFEKIFKNKDDACEAFLSTNMIQTPKGKHFGIEGRVSSPSYSFEWEDDNIGVRSSLKVASRKVAVDLPSEIEGIEPVDVEHNLVMLDIDYFTKTPIRPGQLNVMDWVKQVFRLIKRDSRIFFGDI
jgi:hypothetical protein